MSEFSVMTMQEIEDVATAHNCTVVIAHDNELQFDLDSEEANKQFAEFYTVKLFMRYGDKLPRQSWISKSGNAHWVVTLPEPLPIPERIALQLVGGSDSGREFAALCCFWDGSPHPLLLFKPKVVEVIQPCV